MFHAHLISSSASNRDLVLMVGELIDQEEAFSREILEQLPADLDLPCAAFTQGRCPFGLCCLDFLMV